jgi:CHAD domain-containing protein
MSLDPAAIRHSFVRLSDRLSDLPRLDEDSIHDFRTSARRLQATMGILNAPRGAGAKASKHLKRLDKLRRRAGKVRDLDVLLGLLQSLRLGRERSFKAELLDSLKARREKQRQKLKLAIERRSIERLSRTLKRIEEDPELNARIAAVEAKRFRQGVIAAAVRRFRRIRRSMEPLTVANLHEFRKQCKQIRYLVELAAGEDTAGLLASLKQVQDAIGEWHDWLELRTMAEKMGNGDPSALVAAIRSMEHAKLEAAMRTVERVSHALPSVPRRAVRSAVRVTAPAGARQQPERQFAGFARGSHAVA